MARKFVDLEEAAKMLGVSSETLNEMRERQKIYGYRDGGNWKFKPEDIEKLIAEREAAEQEGEFAELDEDPDSILLSEVELGQSDESTSSTIIGGKIEPQGSGRQRYSTGQAQTRQRCRSGRRDSARRLAHGGSDVLDRDRPRRLGRQPDVRRARHARPGNGQRRRQRHLVEGRSAATVHRAGADGRHQRHLRWAPTRLKLEGSGLAFGGDDELRLGEDSGDGACRLESGRRLGHRSGRRRGRRPGAGRQFARRSCRAPAIAASRCWIRPTAACRSNRLRWNWAARPSNRSNWAKTTCCWWTTQTGRKAAAALAEAAQLAPTGVGRRLSAHAAWKKPAEESDSGSQVIALDGDVEFDEAAPELEFRCGLEARGGGLLEDDLGEGLGARFGWRTESVRSARPLWPRPPRRWHGRRRSGGWRAGREAPFLGLERRQPGHVRSCC